MTTIDARLIADYITVKPTRVVERKPAIEQFAETVTMRRQLCEEPIKVERQASHLEDALLQLIAQRSLIRIEADIVLLEQAFGRVGRSPARPCPTPRLLCSMPGIGATLAYTLLALLPKLGQVGRRQIAALVGLAPYAFDSGRSVGSAHLWRSHSGPQHALHASPGYVPVHPALRTFHHRLVAAAREGESRDRRAHAQNAHDP